MAAGEQYTPEQLAAHFRQEALDVRGLGYVQQAYPLICKFLESQTKQAFHNQTSPGGVPWPNLAHTRARGTSGHVLRDTSELMASVTSGESGHIESVRRLEGTAIIFGTNSVKGFHNFGGMIQRRASRFLTLPATKEALYAGRMRNFPRKLKVYWNEAKGKGIAYERVAVGPKKSKKGGKASKGGSKRSKVSKWRKILKAARKAAGSLLSRLMARRKKRRAASQRKSRGRKPKSRIIIHYYLRAFVIVPQRQFLEIVPKTTEKVGKIIAQQLLKSLKERGR